MTPDATTAVIRAQLSEAMGLVSHCKVLALDIHEAHGEMAYVATLLDNAYEILTKASEINRTVRQDILVIKANDGKSFGTVPP